MRIRHKIAIALVITNLATIGTVGLVAYYSLYHKFNNEISQVALTNFCTDVASYIETYGGWQNAVAKESFDSFVARRSHRIARPTIIGLQRQDPDAKTEGKWQALEIKPTAAGQKLNRPPFHFMIYAPNGTVLKAIPPYRVGDRIAEKDKSGATPIFVYGKRVAYAVHKGDIALSDLDFGYLSAIRRALLLGCGIGIVLAVAFGWLLGTHLSSNLRRLKRATLSIRKGQYDHQPDIVTRDEVGDLAQAFDHMRIELRDNQTALQQSYRKIETQAEALRELSSRDPLTNLYNRRHFDECLAEAHRTTTDAIVVLSDVDNFKRINDRYSHAVGDSVLCRIGDILCTNIRRTDVLARYGGEEFIILLTDISMTQAQSLCEKLRSAIEGDSWNQIADALSVTMSFGLAPMNANTTSDDALKNADRMLYQAKANGRNTVCAPLRPTGPETNGA